MFDNLTKEIIYYSLIPVTILFISALVFLIIKKRENNSYKFNYLIKIILMLIDSAVLALIIGYSTWATARFIKMGTLASNIIYVLIFIVLIVALTVLLVITCAKLYNNINNRGIYEYEYEYEKETYE